MGFITKEKIFNFSIYGFGQAVNLISPLLIMPYIVSVCGETGLGKVGVGFSFALISIVVVDYGSYINGTREISINRADSAILEDKFATIYLAKFMLLVGVLLFSALLIMSIPFLRRDAVQLFLSLLIVVGQFVNPTWFLQGVQNFKAISFINVLSKFIYILAVFAFIKKPGDYIFINAFLGIGMVLAGLIGLAWICRQYHFSLRKFSIDKAVALIREEFSLTVSQLFFSIYQYAPIILISYICGDFVAGQYRIIDQIVMIFRTYLQMFFNFVYAEICLKIYENAKTGLREWKKYNGYNYILILIALVLFYANTDLTLRFFKVKSEDLALLGTYFKIGLAIPVFMSISFAFRQLMFSFDKSRFYIRITIYATIFNTILMVSLLNLVGLKGAFLSTITAELLIITAYLFILKENLTTKQNRHGLHD